MITKHEWQSNILKNRGEIVRELSKLYPIHDLQPINTDSWNSTFKATGDQEAYCVKIVNDVTTGIPRSVSDLIVMCQYVTFLTEKNFGFHVPCIPSYKGTILNQILNYKIMLYPWIEDFSKYSLSEEHAQSPEIIVLGASLLAKLHNISAKHKVSDPVTRELPHCFNPVMWKNNIDGIFNIAFENLRQRNSPQDSINELKKAQKLCLAFINKEDEFFENDLSKQIMNHGDFRPENIIVINQKSSKVFDFDLCHINYPEVDVAYGALAFSGNRWFYGERIWNLVDLFKTTYASQSNIAISPERFEKALIWVLLKSLSTSFKEQQLKPRMQLLYSIIKELAD